MAVQIPDIHVSTLSRAKGDAIVAIASRKDAVHSGEFRIKVNMTFDPAADDYPVGNLEISIDLSDSARGKIWTDTIEQVNSHGKHNPTLFITGRCKHEFEEGKKIHGCRYWVMLVNNRPPKSKVTETPDIVGFVVFDRNGSRVAYGTGPVAKGDINVGPPAN
ncbi:MAG: hypothetical protein A4E35_00772 [Methanoregula sp. PtaU1.Bin051]|nr:MAG: hypothetical protein A4E35_00772 [Methanoregula sp. PtaU1.Bin051]